MGRVLLAVALIAAVCTAVMSPAQAAVTDPFVKVFDTNINGDIQLRGNTLLTCPGGAAGCNGANNALNNNDFSMVYVDVDSDGTTKNSSRATVAMPSGSNVLYAALVWGADTRVRTGGSNGGLSPDVDAALVNQVKMATPDNSSYRTVTADQVTYMGGSPNPYQAFADVTSLVKAGGNGIYTVGAVQAAIGSDRYAGWSLAIAYADPSAPLRNLTLFKGFGSVMGGSSPETVDINVSGFTTPRNGPVRTTLGAVTYEGDRNYTGDKLQLNGTSLSDGLNPSNNVFNSTLSDRGVDQAGRTPQLANQLGFDADTFNADGILANNATSAVIRVNSDNENYYPGLITFATDLYSPQLNGTKSATDINGGNAQPGDVLQYSVTVRNDGIDDAEHSRFTDSMPTGTSYVPGSMQVDGNPLTDGTDSDAGQLVVAKDQLQIELGPGGVMAPNDTHVVTFQASIDSGVTTGLNITNVAVMDYLAASSRLALASPSNVVLNVVPTVNPNQPPVATLDLVTATGAVGTAIPIDVLDNDSDPEGDSLAITAITQPSGGTAAIVGGEIVYTPRTDFAGTDAFTYTINDGHGNETTGTVRVTVVNRRPVAVDNAYTVQAGTTALNVLANDTDPDNEVLSIRSVPATSANGSSLAINGTRVDYTPAPGFRGTDTFTYVVTDPRGESAEATVTVTVNNTPPVADDESVTTPVNTPINIPVLVGDTDADGDALSIVSISSPSHGSAVQAGASIDYTPANGFVGTDTFTYTISDGHGGTDVGSVTVTVNNNVPSAVNDSANTAYATPVSLNVVTNDTDANNDALTLVPGSLTVPKDANGVTRGSAVIDTSSGAGFVRYSPPAGWHGVVTFDYTITDPHGGTATATVTVTVADVGPVAVGATRGSNRGEVTVHDVATHDNDPDGGPVVVTAATVPAVAGTVSFVGSNITFAPAPGWMGPAVINYTIVDDEGHSATAVLTINVNNRPPVAVLDKATTPVGTAVSIDVRRNDTDPDNDALTVNPASLSAPKDGNGQVRGSVSLDNGRVVYTPPAGFSGVVGFTYAVTDPFGGTATTTVSVDVQDQAFETIPASAGKPTLIPVVIVGTDGKSYKVIDVAKPVDGKVRIVDGQIEIIPDKGSDGMTFSGTMIDPDGKIVTQVIKVAVSDDDASGEGFLKSAGMDKEVFNAGPLAVTGFGIAVTALLATVLTGVGAVLLLLRRRPAEQVAAPVTGRRFK